MPAYIRSAIAMQNERGISHLVMQLLRTSWPTFVTRSSQLRRRPLFVNLGSLLQRMSFKSLDINCLYFLEYVGIPPQHANFLRGRAEVRNATLQDLEGLTKCQNTPLLFLNRFKSNDHCVVAVLDGRIVGYQWFCDKPYYVEERYSYRIEIPPDAVYEYDVFILPEHRLSGIWFKFHSLYTRELMQRLHRQRLIGMVDYGNRLSMNTHLRFGFKIFRRVFVIKVFGKSMFITRIFRGDQVPLPRWIDCRQRRNPGDTNDQSFPPLQRPLDPFDQNRLSARFIRQTQTKLRE